ncbi:hypothetical protein GCM10022268_12490 [Sphingomonas cynarae]|uniref:Short chain dehydrogenase-like proteobacteria domain-containing protein n=1 Tax=Sphingomonas cynarae TaxID=930197 RepID=A0ABP7DGE4_9SPHN
MIAAAGPAGVVPAPVVLEPGDDAVELIRALSGDSAVVVIRPGRNPTALALARAAVVALALERAPMRINAVEPGATTDVAAIAGAVGYLASAPAVTGQVMVLR